MKDQELLIWCAGLFSADGSCGTYTKSNGRKDYTYFTVQIQMLDKRSIQRFARCFKLNMLTLPYHHDKTREIYRVMASARVGEEVARKMYPYLRGTDKGDQIKRCLEAAGCTVRRDGTGTRPARTNGLQGKKATQATRDKMSASQKARQERERNARK